MEVVDIFVICSSILVINLLFLASGTAVARSKESKVLNEEDKAFNAEATLREVDAGMAGRFRRAHLNAMENILPFLPMGFLMVETRPSEIVAWALFGGFTFFRLLHSFAYIKAKQPLRTISFGISALILLGIVGYTLVQYLRM